MGIPDLVRSLHRAALEADRFGALQAGGPPRTRTSWPAIHAAMRRTFGEGRHRRGRMLVALDHAPGAVTARFEDGATAESDLPVGADGHGPAARGLPWPRMLGLPALAIGVAGRWRG